MVALLFSSAFFLKLFDSYPELSDSGLPVLSAFFI